MKWQPCLILAAVLLAASTVSAETPSGTVRVFLSSANPSGSWTGDLDLGAAIVTASVEAETAVGFGVLYEVRLNERLGVETGIYFADFDFEIAAIGVSDDFGSALAIPLTLGLNYHPYVGERVDIYVGPLLSYTLWGDLDTPVGVAEVDSDFGVGAVAGMDVRLGGSGWVLSTGLRYITTALSDPTVAVDVDPIFAEIGLGFSF